MKGMKSYISVYTCNSLQQKSENIRVQDHAIESTACSQWQTVTRRDVQDAHSCKETYKTNLYARFLYSVA